MGWRQPASFNPLYVLAGPRRGPDHACRFMEHRGNQTRPCIEPHDEKLFLKLEFSGCDQVDTACLPSVLVLYVSPKSAWTGSCCVSLHGSPSVLLLMLPGLWHSLMSSESNTSCQHILTLCVPSLTGYGQSAASTWAAGRTGEILLI